MAEDLLLYVGQKAFIDRGGEVLVLNDPTYGLDFPGGKIQHGEQDMEQSFLREIKEEVGLEIEIGRPFTTWYFEFEKGHNKEGSKVYLIGFKCKYISGEIVLSDEHDSYEWINKENYKKLDDGSKYFKALEEYYSGS